jgi:DNA-binding MarR family transcriptional regulator
MVASVAANRDDSDLAALAKAMRQTPDRIRAIAARAKAARLIETRRNVVVLTAAGRKLREKVKAYEYEAQGAAAERFRPYTDYRPRGWLPPRKRAI